jgi:hypothetical protein
MKGLGYISPTYQVGNFSAIATKIQTPAPAPATPKVSLFDKILNVGNKVTDFANKGVATYQNISNTLNPQQQAQAQAAAQAAGYTYQAGQSGGSGNQSTGMSTGAKVGIGLGVAALVTGLVLVATRGKKKGMGGLGELNAKGKKKAAAQRAAVFAKLEDEGKAYPKNKNGVRVKRKKRG